LWWGHQIPAWYGPDGAVFVAMDEAEATDAATRHYGRQVPITRDEDVLDTWFSSALWPFSTLGWPQQTPELKRYYPGDVLVTGFDIIFFWVARMMMMGLEFMGDVPFRTVYIHALIRDEHGQKMSKSKGNIIDPLDLIGKYGCDALRFTLAALAAQGRDIKMSEARVEGYRNFATKLWNATRYAQMNECRLSADFDPASAREPVNRWIIGRLVMAAHALEHGLAQYKFNDAASALYQFIWGEFCDWYLEFTKPVLTGSDENAKAETRATSAWILGRSLHLLHPFMPFITEELWDQLSENQQDLISSRWPELSADLLDREAIDDLDWVTRFIGQMRGLRAEMNIPPSTQVSLLLRDAGPKTLARIAKYSDLIRRLARAERLESAAVSTPKGAAQMVIDEATVFMPLSGIIDIAQERARLQKELDKALSEARKIEVKLGNDQFLSRAKPEIVEEQRQRLDEAKTAVTTLSRAIERLSTI
jgi:valyl-tRNA synthetase